MPATPHPPVLPPEFFALPEALYADLPFALEEVPAVVQALWDSQAAQQPTLWLRPGQLRLVGMFPPGDTAQFGFWETVDDLALNQLVWAELEEEARSRGYRYLQGPMNFNTFHPYRLRQQTPSWGAFEGEPVNPDYYPRLLTGLGFAPALTYESRLLTRERAGPQIYQAKAAFLDRLPEIPFDFIPLNPDSWRAHAEEIYHLAHAIFGQNPGFRGISQEEFALRYNEDFARKLCPYTSVLFRDQASGQLVALSFCLPHYRPLGLRRPPRFERDHPRLLRKTMLAKTQGVHPDFRRRNLFTYLAAYGMRVFLDHYDEALFCLMRSGNFSLRLTDGFPHEKSTYALYRKALL